MFERDGEPACIALQYGRLEVPAREGVAFPLVKKLLISAIVRRCARAMQRESGGFMKRFAGGPGLIFLSVLPQGM